MLLPINTLHNPTCILDKTLNISTTKTGSDMFGFIALGWILYCTKIKKVGKLKFILEYILDYNCLISKIKEVE